MAGWDAHRSEAASAFTVRGRSTAAVGETRSSHPRPRGGLARYAHRVGRDARQRSGGSGMAGTSERFGKAVGSTGQRSGAQSMSSKSTCRCCSEPGVRSMGARSRQGRLPASARHAARLSGRGLSDPALLVCDRDDPTLHSPQSRCRCGRTEGALRRPLIEDTAVPTS